MPEITGVTFPVPKSLMLRFFKDGKTVFIKPAAIYNIDGEINRPLIPQRTLEADPNHEHDRPSQYRAKTKNQSGWDVPE